MIIKALKKPIEIEAVIWTGSNVDEIESFTKNKTNISFYEIYKSDKVHLYIKTLEGKMHASINDYIIKGINGEFYPCKPDIFHKTYSIIE